MISKKICMLGGFSVGKTSLVDRYVHSIFSDKYLSTVGLKISKKELEVDGVDINMVLWDLEGKDVYSNMNMAYLRGAMGFFAVADGTRKETLEMAIALRELAMKSAGEIASCLLINKADIMDQWEITESMLNPLVKLGIPILLTSAQSGFGVNEAFVRLARDMLRRDSATRKQP